VPEGRLEVPGAFEPLSITMAFLQHTCLNHGEVSLNLNVFADFYVESDGIAEILEAKDERGGPQVEDKSLKMRKGIILDQVASLLGDEVTSDVIVSLQDKDKKSCGNFYCHSYILSGNYKYYLQYYTRI